VIVWIDAQLPPTLVHWFKQVANLDAVTVGALGLGHATDYQIYLAARNRGAVVVTKDRDFAELSWPSNGKLLRNGSPEAIRLLRSMMMSGTLERVGILQVHSFPDSSRSGILRGVI